jgi:hypothetical protein
MKKSNTTERSTPPLTCSMPSKRGITESFDADNACAEVDARRTPGSGKAELERIPFPDKSGENDRSIPAFGTRMHLPRYTEVNKNKVRDKVTAREGLGAVRSGACCVHGRTPLFVQLAAREPHGF